MDERSEKWLYDIALAIEELESFTAQMPEKSFNQYKTNTLLKRAIEREMEIIGEAMNRILKADPSFVDHIPEAKNIIGFRNQIIHAYDSISDEIVWAILIRHIPELKTQVRSFLHQA